MKKHDVTVGEKALEGILRLPDDAMGLVIFAHGAGSSRLSPRNNHVASRLGESRLATLLFDLLTEEEGQDRRNVFDIPLLGARLTDAVGWARKDERLRDLPVGLFGSSTGAAAALVAAAELPDEIGAVVSRGGRPDLAGDALGKVRAPVLLVVGGNDQPVIGMNEKAGGAMQCEWELKIVPGATHLFEEPGTLDQVVDHAAEWFETRLGGARS